MGTFCQMCGAENSKEARFCSTCGRALQSARPEAAASEEDKTQTMAVSPGVSPSAHPTRSRPFADRTTSPDILEQTITGMPTATPKGLSGIPMVEVSRQTPSNPAHALDIESGRTIMGMKAVHIEAPVEKKPQQPTAQPAALNTPERTVSTASTAEKSASAQSGRPRHPVKEQKKQAYRRKKSNPVADRMFFYENSTEHPPRDRGGSSKRRLEDKVLLVMAVIAAAIALSAISSVVYFTVFDRSKTLRPQIFANADGKSVTVKLSFPDAPPGATIRAAGQTVPVNKEQATVTVAMNRLKIGKNNIAISYTQPGHPPEQMSFPIVLRHSIHDDLRGLLEDDPFFTVVFQTAPGIRLTVNGKPVQTAGNVYSHRINLKDIPNTKTKKQDSITVRLPFQLIDEAGATEQGEHLIEIPLTHLQIDRPAPNATIASKTLICSGTAEKGAQVTVDQKPATLTEAGFKKALELDSLGEHRISIVALAPGKAPQKIALNVTRIESLAPAVAQWSKDLDTSLDYPAAKRAARTSPGKKVKLKGRVVNINTEKGVTAFILYVSRGCSARSKCAAYVVFRGETDATLQSRVEVYGTLQGTETVEMEHGKKIEVPSVDAAFVLKTEPRKSRKQKR